MKTPLLLLLSVPVLLLAQVTPKDIEQIERAMKLDKPSGIVDRAAGTHNTSNIGNFFENRGKLYPRRLAQGPSGEFPINSGKHYNYRINPMVGIPGNVVQGRYTTNEEWEAVGGYQASGSAKIAFSDNPATWPATGWPVKDSAGNPVIRSDQDSYCVYDDANNQRGAIGLRVIQTGYAYGLKSIQNIIFFTFQIVTTGTKTLDKLYFGLYTDIDVGDASGGVAEYADDRFGFDRSKNFVYFYDDGVTTEWPDGKTGYFGVALLKTPKVGGTELGLTDFHYNLYNDDKDHDTIQYGIYSSAASLYNSVDRNRYFHLGSATDLHFDDPATVPPTGLDLVGNLGSGPYTLNPGDTLTFVTAMLAGTDSADIFRTYAEAYKVFQNNFEAAKPPVSPVLTGVAGDRRVTLFWDDRSERSRDSYSGQYDFEGYRLYRSVDKGINWKLLADHDIVNEIGLDKGLKYSYIDSTVTNGIEYWYSITAFDRGDSGLVSLESPLGKVAGVSNLAVIVPRTNALGRVPVALDSSRHVGNGRSNYRLNVIPPDIPSLGNSTYDVSFTYSSRFAKGAPSVRMSITTGDSTKVVPEDYGFEFVAPNQVKLYNLTTGLEFAGNPKIYNAAAGTNYTIQGGTPSVLRIRLEPSDTVIANRPKAGDYVTVNFSTRVVRNGTDTVVAPRQFSAQPDRFQSTYDGIVFSMRPPDELQNVRRDGRQDPMSMSFSVGRSDSIRNASYRVTTTGKGTDASAKPFISLLVTRMTDTVNVASFDTVYSGGSADFSGIRATVEFPATNVPLAGNSFLVESVIPVPPTLADRYRFTIRSGRTDAATTKAGLSSIRVVPNPYIVSSLYEPEFGELRREPIRQIQFTNLPAECTIHIFTVDANLVKTIRHSSPSGGTATWDLKSEGGREIASGVYMYLVKSDAGEYMHRFAVIK
ncbi:MAG: hypothetical protein F9K22_02585 [Bacteroidetes bacterium]|nr:MAG: hypothetical protein F9K22_02585 [Bacteroidota bacterium]